MSVWLGGQVANHTLLLALAFVALVPKDVFRAHVEVAPGVPPENHEGLTISQRDYDTMSLPYIWVSACSVHAVSVLFSASSFLRAAQLAALPSAHGVCTRGLVCVSRSEHGRVRLRARLIHSRRYVVAAAPTMYACALNRRRRRCHCRPLGSSLTVAFHASQEPLPNGQLKGRAGESCCGNLCKLCATRLWSLRP